MCSTALPLPSHLWAVSLYPDHMGFLVQWEMGRVSPTPPTASEAWSHAVPGSQYAVEWRSEETDSLSGWTRVNNTSAVIQGRPQPAWA